MRVPPPAPPAAAHAALARPNQNGAPMTLQQLRYLIAIAEYGSINAAAQNLYASQSNLSTAIKDLEQELGITVFTRSNRGVTLTNDGAELLGYARQVIEQTDMLEARYAHSGRTRQRLAVSTQHYAFSVQAFVNVIEACEGDEYEFVLRERATGEIIDDVRTFRSEVGVLYTDSFNRRVLLKAFDDADIAYFPLFDAQVHVFVGEHHPLAQEKLLQPEDLEEYPRYSFEQGTENSFYYSEEPLLTCRTSATCAYRTGERSPTCSPATTATRFPLACCRRKCIRALRPSRWTWTRPCRWATSCTTSAAPAPCFCATSRSAASRHQREPHCASLPARVRRGSRHPPPAPPNPVNAQHEKSRLRWAGPALRGFEAFGYLLAPMRQMVVPQSGHLPFVMGLPFFVVLSTGSCITFFALHFTQ